MDFMINQVHHVFNQGNNRQKIFFQPRNYLFFLEKMREFILPYADFLSYSLMPNHFHFLIYVYRLELPTPAGKMRTINDSIGIMLRSYTRAINKQEDRSGVLFRPKTKSKYELIEDGFITIDGPKKKYFFETEHQYAQRCFHYIHQNAVKANLVKRAIDWIYSSAREYAGISRKRFCNIELAKELGLVTEVNPLTPDH